MKPPTIGVCVASCDEADLLPDCLTTLQEFNDVIVFDLQCADGTATVARSFGARVIVLPRPPYIEQVRGLQLAECHTDWVLFVDPDERLPLGWAAAAKRLAGELPDDVSAVWLGYQERAFGVDLRHTRYGAAKIALFRRSDVRPLEASEVRPHEPIPVTGTVLPVSTHLPLIIHVGYRSVGVALEKLVRYAQHEGVGSAHDPHVTPLTGLRMLWGNVIMSGAYRDGTAGVAVASLSAIGDYLGLLQRWDLNGRPEAPARRRDRFLIDVGRVAHRSQLAVRRNLHRRH